MMERKAIRVLRIINRFNLGGPTFNVAYLTAYLDAPFQTKLVGGMKDESEASSEFILDELGIQPTIVAQMERSISPVKDLRAYREIDQIIRSYRPHIVHTHASKAGTLGRLAAYRNKVPVILHTFHGHVFHSYFSSLKTNLFKGIERTLAQRSTRIIAISEIQRKELGDDHRIAPLERIEVVPLGFNLDRFQQDQPEKRAAFRARYGLKDAHVAIGIIGRLVPIKNHRMFIDAIPATLQRFPNARFIIVGDGEMKADLQAYCTELGLDCHEGEQQTAEQPVVFTSWIKEVDHVMAGTDIVALTSLNEGTPVSLIEAQAAEKPVVSTRVGGIGDIVVEGSSALLCNVGETEAFSNHLMALCADEGLRKQMGKVGRTHVVERYSYQRLVRDMKNLYLSLLKEKGISYSE